MQKKEDRRIQRTRQSLQSALIDLILDRGYEQISVQDIVDRANIGRSTFYSHYSSKDAVFFDSFQPLESMLRKSQTETMADPNYKHSYRLGFTKLLFAHVGEDQHLYRALAGERGGTLAANQVKKILVDLVGREFSKRLSKNNVTPIVCEAATHFAVGAIIGILTWWLDHKTGWTSSEADEYLQSLMSPGLQAIFASEDSAY
ncbi:MAG: TetR/AcrR family transcriptional regulator [Gammaproteobacteria bacterium]|nr:TetR/AcrR family transcriptional regulator [Gammaproteobacteria bacterium]